MTILTSIIAEKFGYAQPVEMIKRFESKEIAELIDDSGLVTATILETYLNHGNLIGLTAQEKSALTEGIKVLCRACHDADGIVEIYLKSAGIAVPMQSRILAIENAACDIARYYLYDIQVPDVVRERYNEAMEFLKQIANKKLNLGTDAPRFVGYGVDITSEDVRFTL